MRKRDELSDLTSCLNKAGDDEWTFVFLERDEDAPATIRYWVARRIKRGKNKPGDPKMVEALRWADTVEAIHTAKADATPAAAGEQP